MYRFSKSFLTQLTDLCFSSNFQSLVFLEIFTMNWQQCTLILDHNFYWMNLKLTFLTAQWELSKGGSISATLFFHFYSGGVVENWCRKWRQEVNLAKTNILHVRNPRQLQSKFVFLFNWRTVNYCKSYRYLGATLE